MSTQITITGNTTREPELRYTPSGTAVTNLDVAVNSRRKDAAGNWIDGETTFYPVTVWGDQAENVAQTIGPKSARVTVTGRIGARSWETTEGEKRTHLEVVADEVSVSLRWATATISKVNGSRPEEPPAEYDEPPF